MRSARMELAYQGNVRPAPVQRITQEEARIVFRGRFTVLLLSCELRYSGCAISDVLQPSVVLTMSRSV